MVILVDFVLREVASRWFFIELWMVIVMMVGLCLVGGDGILLVFVGWCCYWFGVWLSGVEVVRLV